MKAAIWKNLYQDDKTGESRTFQSVVFKNVYREEGEWRESDSFTASDLLKLKVVVDKAIAEIVPVKINEA